MLKGLLNLFNSQFQAEDIKLPTKEIGWVDTNLYSFGDIPRYNPDILIGRKGYGVYKKMMRDEQVKAVVRFKRDAVTSRDWFFSLDAEKSGLSDEEIETRLKVYEEIVRQIKGSFTDALNASMSALYNGFSMVEKVYKQIDVDGLTYWGIKRLPLRPFDTFYFYTDQHGRLLKVTQEVTGHEQKLDHTRFIHFLVNPDVDEYYGQSELHEAYRAYFSKDVIIKFRNIWLERHASGFRWLQVKDGKTLAPGSTEYANLKTVLESIQAGSAAILPSTVELNSEYPNNQVAFRDAIIDDNLAIAKALLVPNLLGITETGYTGSFAQSETHLEAFLWTLDALATRLEEVYNEQLFIPLGEINFGDGIYPWFTFKPISERQKMKIIKIWQELVSGQAVTRSESDETHIRELLEFPERSEDAEIIESETDISEEPELKDNEEIPDETVIGTSLVSVTAFNRALKRVDFSVIADRSTKETDKYTDQAGKVMAAIADDATVRIQTEEVLEDIEKINKFKLNSALKAKLRRVANAALKAGWRIGEIHAETEIDKAMGEAFSLRVNREKIKFIGDKYFDLRSFAIAGNFTDRALALIKNILINAAKGDKSIEETQKEIYRTFAREGMIDQESVVQALGEAFPDTVKNTVANLHTVIRTNLFEAINEARWAYFNDPALEGFVEALEYSAILDERTTQICRELDGQIHSVDSEVWETHRPPNHHNCRSLLVPVTRNDTWVENDPPVLDPQKGFE